MNTSLDPTDLDMKITRVRAGGRQVGRKAAVRGAAAGFVVAVVAFLAAVAASAFQADQGWRTGERLTYNISFNNYDSAGYAEIQVVSKGTLEGREAVELSGKLRSVDLFSAAFFLWDDARTTFVAPDSGYPIYIRSISSAGIVPAETTVSFLQEPAQGFDLLSLVYRARRAGGAGSFVLIEAGRAYSVDLIVSGAESVKTEAGEFETQVSQVQSSYFKEMGVSDVRVYFSNDDARIPVLFRLRTPRGELTARLASVQDLTPVPEETDAARPTPTPVPVMTPTPEPTPVPYVENMPLARELPFALGETLTYSISKGGQAIAEISLKAKERKLIRGQDSLLLSAKIESVGEANDLFDARDSVESWVDPDTLAPSALSMSFSGTLTEYNAEAFFDQNAGIVTMGTAVVQVPVGTHNVLSLAYAVRAFNLRATPDPSSTVNDTRVAVFAGSGPVVLTLRPAATEVLAVGGRKRPAQMISIRTGAPEIDRLNIRLWLSVDGRRIPLQFQAGDYLAKLVSVRTERPK